MFVSGQPQFFAYLDRVVGGHRSQLDTILRDFRAKEYAVVEERVLAGTSVSAVFKDLGHGHNIFIMIAEGDTAGLKYSIATNQMNMLWHYGIMYGFPVIMIKGPATLLHDVNIGLAFFHDEGGATLSEVKQGHGRPVLKDGTSVRILRLRPTFLGVPIN